MPRRSKTFGARPNERVRVRVQTLRAGRAIKTKSYAVHGSSQLEVERLVERVLSKALCSPTEVDPDDERPADDAAAPAAVGGKPRLTVPR